MTAAVATATIVPALPGRLTLVGGDRVEQPDDTGALRVLLITEGTYPYAWGGVSTWCDSLVNVLPELDFHIVSIVSEPDMMPVFELPANVRSVNTVPLWGVQDPKESWSALAGRQLRSSRAACSAEAITTEFIPAFAGFLRGLVESGDTRPLAGHIHAIYRYLRTHDLAATMKAPQVWDLYADIMQEAYGRAADDLALPQLELWELSTGMQWVSRWLFALAAEIPPVDVVHAAMAGVCSVVAVAAREEHQAGFLLTEHGVFLRERYIFEGPRTDSYFLKFLGLRFARRMTEMTYALAEQVSPCCEYNQRWELEVGAVRGQLETIYYGVDANEFSADRPVSAIPRTVVWVGRINPLKDVETLLHAAAATVHERPDVEFLLYGGAPDEDAEYYERCLALHAQLELGESVKFCGFTDDPAAAFNSGDLVVLSSISEGFPYSTLEAMLCARPIVATAVGGLREQVGPAGTIVEPRDAPAMARAILDILNDPERCAALGATARARALGKFGQSKFRATHLASYRRLASRYGNWQVLVDRPGAAAPAIPAQRRLPDAPAGTAVTGGEVPELDHVDLGLEVERRSPVPVDALEVAAILESMGVTDLIARRRYSEAHVFALATTLFRAATETRRSVGDASRTGSRPAPRAPGGGPFDPARYPAWALLPPCALILSIWVMSTMGRWHGTRAVSLTVGMSAGMLSTNGIALAMGRRASISLSLGKVPTARRYFLCCLIVGVVWAAVLTGGISLIPWRAIDFLARDRALFVAAAVVLSVIWMTAAALSLVAATGWTGISLAAGILSAGASYRVLPPAGAHRALIASVIGVVVVIAAMLARLEHEVRKGPSSPHAHRLPSKAFLIEEGRPYFAFGTMGVVMFVLVHVVGWARVQGDPIDVTTLELGLCLPLFPAVLGAGHAERILRRFWKNAQELQHSTLSSAREEFGSSLYRQYALDLRRYGRRLLGTSLVTVGGVEVLIRVHALERVAAYRAESDVRLLFLSGLVAYAVIAIAQFNCMFALSFNELRGPLRSVSVGIIVTLIASVWLASAFGFAFMGVALSLGAVAYAVLSFREVRILLLSSDLHYVTAA
ncbi:MAG: GT4 family glycosyltransferase PelF [Mycobacteriales bacterium]